MAQQNHETSFENVQTPITYYSNILDVIIQKFALIFHKTSSIILQYKSLYCIYTLKWQITSRLSIKSITPFVEVINTTIMSTFIISFFHNSIKSFSFCRLFSSKFHLKYAF